MNKAYTEQKKRAYTQQSPMNLEEVAILFSEIDAVSWHQVRLAANHSLACVQRGVGGWPCTTTTQ